MGCSVVCLGNIIKEENSHSRQRAYSLSCSWKFNLPFGFTFFPSTEARQSRSLSSLSITFKLHEILPERSTDLSQISLTVTWCLVSSEHCICYLFVTASSAVKLLTPKDSDFRFNEFLLCWLQQSPNPIYLFWLNDVMRTREWCNYTIYFT